MFIRKNLTVALQKSFSLITMGLLVSFLTACGSSSNSEPEDINNGVTHSVSLSSEQEVPAVVSSGTGQGSVTLDESNGDIDGSITMTGLSSAIGAVHIHAAEAGLNGAVLITLEKGSDDNTWNIPAGSSLDNEQIAAFLAGKMYFNVHTANNGGGEVRGQIVPAGIQVIRTVLDGSQEVPNPVTTTSGGVGYVTINTASRAISGNLRTTDLIDASAAHIHSGFAGTSGGIVATFVQDTSDIALWQLPANTVLTAEQLSQLNAGGNYFNIHNPANPAGVLRGQVVPDGIAVVRSAMTAAQEVPPAVSAGSGVGYATVNATTGAITANIRTFGLGGTETASHIHEAAAGSNGGVKITFEQADVADTSFWTSPVGSTLDAALLAAFNSGNLYFNLHTTTVASGELRGQVTP